MKNNFFVKIAAGLSLLFMTTTVNAQNAGSSTTSKYDYMRTMNSVFDFIDQNFVDTVDSKILYEGALKGMLEALGDPYSIYLDEEYMRDLSDTTEGSFGGVGLTITKPIKNTLETPAFVEVSSPIPDTPGYKAGIQSGDLIIAVEGKPTDSMTMNEVLGMLRGPVGTPVLVTIRRGASMEFDVKIVRALIEIPTVKYSMIEGTSIGYLQLLEFTPESANRVQDALNEFQKNGYTGLILDVRNNPGGLLSSAIDIVDKFVDSGVIVSTKSRLILENQEYTARKYKTTVKKNFPVVVLINNGSASASEILSGALKDHKIAYLIGTKTYGKGSVQQVLHLSDTDGFKLTMARYYTPSDVNIDKIGIPPDLEIQDPSFLEESEREPYKQLREDNAIDKYIAAHPGLKEKDIPAAAETLSKDYAIDLRLLRKLLRDQLYKNQDALVYDLDYDLQLNEAINVLNAGNFKTLVKTTKTLKQLQEEAEAKESNE